MKSKNIFLSLFALCALVFLISCSLLIKYYVDDTRYTNDLAALAAQMDAPPVLEVESESENDRRQNSCRLFAEQNPDFAGWLSIEGTTINYPVMFTPDEPEYYLNRDFNKRHSAYGLPFIDGTCPLNGDNLVIYGHHIRNGKMFGALMNYTSPDFYAQHPVIRFDTADQGAEYDIVAVFKTQVYTADPNTFFYYLFTKAETERDYDDYVHKAKELSLYETGVTPSYGQQLITLSTCEYSQKNGRFVIVAAERKSVDQIPSLSLHPTRFLNNAPLLRHPCRIPWR